MHSDPVFPRAAASKTLKPTSVLESVQRQNNEKCAPLPPSVLPPSPPCGPPPPTQVWHEPEIGTLQR
eukprot:7941025-Pyramimonas_sp.AAC.1